MDAKNNNDKNTCASSLFSGAASNTTSSSATRKSDEDVDYKSIFELAAKQKQDGNTAFGNKKYQLALAYYLKGLEYMARANDDEDTSRDLICSLEVTLESNLSLTFFRLHQYYSSRIHITKAIDLLLAEQQKKSVLEEQQQHQQNILSSEHRAKLLYRRAMTLQQLGNYEEARVDLLHCLELYNTNTSTSSTQGKQVAISAMSRIDHKLLNNQHNNNIPTATHQYQIINQLFQQQQGTSAEGEAFYLLNWKWWSQWCQHVHFLVQQELEEEDEKKFLTCNGYFYYLNIDFSKRARRRRKTSIDDNDSATTSEEEDSNTETSANSLGKKPGPIDNSSLTTEQRLLRSNLVRGYHYELIPREVYNALRCWYAEITEPILRRTTLLSSNNNCRTTQLCLYPEHKSIHINGTDSTTPYYKRMTYCTTCQSPAARRCTRCYSVYYCSRECQASHWMYHKIFCGTGNPTTTRGGKCGLGNLGNTCFMNSALQCLSHSYILTKYFLSNRYMSDLNTSNPLGSGGRLTHAIADLMKELWIAPADALSSANNNGSSGAYGSCYTLPTNVKRAVAQFAPRFSGCAQHDSQEFLAYLLDGLHEDLNRIPWGRTPYVSMPDYSSEDHSEKDSRRHFVDAAESWDAYQKRNSSLIVDSCYGQFKSTCFCPLCNRVSVSFDVFNHVSLELPQFRQPIRNITVFFHRLAGTKNNNTKEGLPVSRYTIKVPQNGNIDEAARALSKLCGIRADTIIFADVIDGRLQDIYGNNKKLFDGAEEEDVVLTAYEITAPTTINNSKELPSPCILAFVSQTIKCNEPQEQCDDRYIGFSFFASFDAQSSCSDALRQIWLSVYHCLGLVNVTERDANNLQVKAVDENGDELPAFQDFLPDNFSCIPNISSLKLIDVLGDDCAKRIIFLTIAWGKQYTLSSGEQIFLDERKFLAFQDHSPVLDNSNYKTFSNSAITLEHCLEAFTSPERLDEQNAWYCNRCKKHVRAMKTIELWRLPDVLIIHLKRFDSKNVPYGNRDKLDTFVDFPIRKLDMSHHCAAYNDNTHKQSSDDAIVVKDKVPAEYDLFGVINHYGRLGFGHYTAFARRWNDVHIEDEWSAFDDSSVSRIDNESSIITSAAYVLFYRRRAFSMGAR